MIKHEIEHPKIVWDSVRYGLATDITTVSGQRAALDGQRGARGRRRILRSPLFVSLRTHDSCNLPYSRWDCGMTWGNPSHHSVMDIHKHLHAVECNY
jgi:hypothetical protein